MSFSVSYERCNDSHRGSNANIHIDPDDSGGSKRDSNHNKHHKQNGSLLTSALFIFSAVYQRSSRSLTIVKSECRRLIESFHGAVKSNRNNNNNKTRRQQQSKRRYEDDRLQSLLTNALVIVLFAITICVFLLTVAYLFVLPQSSQQEREDGDGASFSHHRGDVPGNNNNNQEEIHSKHQRGIHVIVGQFLGKGYPWKAEPNLTIGDRNVNGYFPMMGAGENGVPVHVPASMRSRANQLFFVNRFNLIASDMISVDRSLPDARKIACRRIVFTHNNLPDTSIIVVFHNEAWSTLVRTIHSVVNRSPHNLLAEILLVDDASNRTFLGQELEDHVTTYSNQTGVSIRILRSSTRIGLINARILGAKQAKGKVLTFLDAHVEATTGWLEPLLHRISQDRTVVVCPVIDIINDETFAYAKSFDLHWGAMNWALNFRWYSIGQREVQALRKRKLSATEPFRTPIMAGGLFSIDKGYFFEMGAYDTEMHIWGGENIEMSLRIWQCGGRVEIAPCSHVAHLFRSSSPYSFGDDKVANVLFANLIRVVEVWMDEWKNFYYLLNPSAARLMDTNSSEILHDIESRIALRDSLSCKPFSWFLDNIWPESFFPTEHRQFGQIQSLSSHECIQSPGTGRNPTGRLLMYKCSIEPFTPQSFVMPKPNQEGYIQSDESVCFDSSDPKDSSPVSLIACGEFNRQKWILQPNGYIVHAKTKLCLTLDIHSAFLSLRECSKNRRKQLWKVLPINWKK